MFSVGENKIFILKNQYLVHEPTVTELIYTKSLTKCQNFLIYQFNGQIRREFSNWEYFCYQPLLWDAFSSSLRTVSRLP